MNDKRLGKQEKMAAKTQDSAKQPIDKLEKVLKLSNDEVLAAAIRDILNRDKAGLYR